MSDIKTDIRYGATVAFSKEELEHSNFEIIPYKLERQAADLGVFILNKKGWIQEEHPDMEITEYRRNLYVFTPNELRDYMDAKFKERLQNMAAKENWLNEDQRHALMVQSERF